jgi:hypothetical protein
MPTVTLLEKLYGSLSPKAFEAALSPLLQGLKIRWKVVGETDRGWIQIEFSGEDETAASNYLSQKIGLAPVSIENMRKSSAMRGKIVSSGERKDSLYVDIGVFSPKICDATIPLQTLQAQLANGNNIPLKRLIELFCLRDNMPLKVKILGDPNVQMWLVEAELSESQISQLVKWVKSNLDRLIVMGVPLSSVEYAIKASRHFRDIIRIESLSLFEHAILCKLGTDAVGLIPKLGPLLPTAILAPFSPRKIRQDIGRKF